MNRSKGLTAFTAVYVVAGCILILGGLPNITLGIWVGVSPYWILPYVCFIIMGAALCVIGYGMWRAEPWAWWAWVGVSLSGIAIAVLIHVCIALWFPVPATLVPVPVFLRFFIRPELGIALGVLAASILSIWYARKPHVKRYFGVG